VIADRGLHGETRTLEWHVNQIEAELDPKLLADEMSRRTGSARGVAVFAWIGLDQCNQLAHRPRQRWMDRDDHR
jgi:hypothetical protein